MSQVSAIMYWSSTSPAKENVDLSKQKPTYTRVTSPNKITALSTFMDLDRTTQCPNISYFPSSPASSRKYLIHPQ